MAVTKKRGQFVQTEVVVKNTGNIPIEKPFLELYYYSQEVHPGFYYRFDQPISTLSPGQTQTQAFGKLITDDWPLGFYKTIVTFYERTEDGVKHNLDKRSDIDLEVIA